MADVKDIVNDFKTLDNTWTGVQTFSETPEITGTITSSSPSTTVVNKNYVDLTVGDVGSIVDAINELHAEVAPMPTLSHMWSDHEVRDMSWLKSTDNWSLSSDYSVVYDHLASDIAGKTTNTETITSVADGTTTWTVNYYLAEDGHKICPASEDTKLTQIYEANGIAWYYVIDTANNRFKLPKNNGKTYGITLESLKAYIDSEISNIRTNMRDYTIDFTKTDGFSSLPNYNTWPLIVKYPSRIYFVSRPEYQMMATNNLSLSSDPTAYSTLGSTYDVYTNSTVFVSESIALSSNGTMAFLSIQPIKC